MNVFLSYNSKNRKFVNVIASNLIRDGFIVFFDKESIVAGENWSQVIKHNLENSDAALIFIGEEGIGDWQEKEVLVLAAKNTKSANDYKIIPIILPTASKAVYEPFWVLVNYEWIQFSEPNDQTAYANVLTSLRTPSKNYIPIGENPYKGLQSFGVGEQSIFYGRSFEINQVFHNNLRFHISVQDHNFLAVVAESGAGKTSFVQAGIMSALQTGKFQRSELWVQIIFKPGKNPLKSLSTALFNDYEAALTFEKAALNDREVLCTWGMTLKERTVIYIDQFEEVITQHPRTESAEDKVLAENRRKAFLNNLVSALDTDKLIILLSLRSDYYTHFANYPSFKTRLEKNNYTLPQISLDEMDPLGNNGLFRDIISRPAQNAGVKIAANLETQLIHSLSYVNGKLPILQLTLDLLWKQRAPGSTQITLEDFAAISHNQDLAGIIQTHADSVYVNITNGDKEREHLFRRIFVPFLIEISEGAEDVRRTAEVEEILTMAEADINKVEKMLNDLSNQNSRLITIDSGKVAVIHEVIIREWPLLRKWVDERRDSLVYREKLRENAIDFANGSASLLSGSQLTRALSWRQQNPDLVSNSIENLIIQSQKAKYKRGIIIGLLVVGLILISWWSYSFNEKRRFIQAILNTPSLNLQWEASGGSLDSIKSLDLNNTNYLVVRGNIGYLKNLTNVNLSNLPGRDIPILAELKSVRSMSIDGNENLVSIANMPYLPNLVTLQIRSNPALTKLTGIENLKNLRSLQILYNDTLTNLDGLQALRNLKSLDISNNKLLTKILGLDKLTNLDSLNISGNQNLLRIGDLAEMKKLYFFKLDQNHIKLNLDGINKIRSLKFLSIYGSLSFKGFEQLRGLDNLQSLTIRGADNFSELGGLDKLKALRFLSISDNNNFKNFKVTFEGIRIDSLVISGNDHLASVDGLERLNNLRFLEIASNKPIKYISGIEKIRKLENLIVSRNDSLVTISCTQTHTILRSVTIWDNKQLDEIKGLGNMKEVRSLAVYDNSSLKSLSGIGDMANLEDLLIRDNNKLANVPELRMVKNLKSLDISGNVALENITHWTELRKLQHLVLDKNDTLGALKDMDKLPNLTNLTLSTSRLANIVQNSIVNKNVRNLSIKFNQDLVNISGIQNLPNLNFLEITYNHKIQTIDKFQGLNGILGLNISSNSSLKTLSLAGSDKLRSLIISENRTLKKISGLNKLSALKSLTISDNYQIESIEGLSEIATLDTLKLGFNEANLNAIFPKMSNLKVLILAKETVIDYKQWSKNNPGLKIDRVNEGRGY